MLDRNPSLGVKLPRAVRTEMACLTAEEVERLGDAVPIPYRPLIHVLAYGGLRWGEAVALRRRRCDLDAGRLIVAESLADVNGRAIFGDTKTHRVRKTRIPRFLVEELSDASRDGGSRARFPAVHRSEGRTAPDRELPPSRVVASA